jgi:hypothetical protein
MQTAHTLLLKALSVGDGCCTSSTQETQRDGKYASDLLPRDQTRDLYVAEEYIGHIREVWKVPHIRVLSWYTENNLEGG